MGFITPWGHAPAAAAAPALRQHCCCLLPSLGAWIRQQQAFHAAACRDTAAGTLRAQSRCTAVRSGMWPSTHHCSGPRHPLGHTLPSTRQALLPLHQLTAAQHTQAYRQRDADFQGSGSDHLLEYQSPPLDMEQGQPQVPGSATPTVPIEDQELLQVGIVGAPNAGKSTLTNALVGVKVRGAAFLFRLAGMRLTCGGYCRCSVMMPGYSAQIVLWEVNLLCCPESVRLCGSSCQPPLCSCCSCCAGGSAPLLESRSWLHAVQARQRSVPAPEGHILADVLEEVWLRWLQVTATSNKTNTTHRVALGAFTQGTKQVALYDTPGIVSPR